MVLAMTFMTFFAMSGVYFLVSYFAGDEFAASDQQIGTIAGGLLAAFVGSLVVFVSVLLLGMFLQLAYDLHQESDQ